MEMAAKCGLEAWRVRGSSERTLAALDASVAAYAQTMAYDAERVLLAQEQAREKAQRAPWMIHNG